jgi:diguanylate cyclase
MEQRVPRILIVDDNENIHEDIKYILSQHNTNMLDTEMQSLKDELFGDEDSEDKNNSSACVIRYRIDDAYQGEEAVGLVKSAIEEDDPYSLIFMDVRMPPGMDGIQTIGEVWQVDRNVEVVICTAYSDYTWERIVSKFGQTDGILFIKKPFDSISIKQIALSLTTKWTLAKINREHIENLEIEVRKRTQTLNQAVEKLTEEIALRRDKETQLAYIAHYDSLTGLLKRRSFYKTMKKLTEYNNDLESKEAFALLFIDIDGFKAVNDQWGHGVGDLLLKEIAQRIDKVMGDVSYKVPHILSTPENQQYTNGVFRLGGDEFTVILNTVDKVVITAKAQELIHTISQPYFINKYDVYISCSVGISLYLNDGVADNEILKQADTAMYVAKEIKGAYIFFDEIRNTGLMYQITLASDIGAALEKKQVEVHYQAVLNNDNKVIGITAYARWHHPQYGTIMPMDFIPLAERTSQILKIGKNILYTSCMHLKMLHNCGYENLFVLVNCTNKQFYDNEFIDIIKSVLNETGLEPKYLKLGLEERFSLQNPERSIAIINELSLMGIQFMVKGFGSSNSIFNFLKNLPANTIIKIDKSFVENITQSDEDRVFLSTILDLIKNRKLNALVSGIETPEQEQILKSKDCILQGYLFDFPKPFKEFFADLTDMQSK